MPNQPYILSTLTISMENQCMFDQDGGIEF
jgi:hypothetical protein